MATTTSGNPRFVPDDASYPDDPDDTGEGMDVSGVSARVTSNGSPSSPTSESATRFTCSHSVALGARMSAPSRPFDLSPVLIAAPVAPVPVEQEV